MILGLALGFENYVSDEKYLRLAILGTYAVEYLRKWGALLHLSSDLNMSLVKVVLANILGLLY